ncbi:plasmid stabilization protein ParE [Vandammella animalimorsus]|uniref:Toxin n=1 Tax=Vandammella animalimorsus TaxID=2029117 RepID=A0A2A2A9T9_9BURK|nr:plasmid stabilization protein ParE [Vandammella animalimorsus]PAT39656.1 plasmid stabilization protein ParE [Vandammella animalimorsus]
MPVSYQLTNQAVADLASIWEYSANQWGIAQAERYVRLIDQACQALGAGRLQGQSAEAIRSGYHKYVIGQHLLFYRHQGSNPLLIVRILHQRMDAARHLE